MDKKIAYQIVRELISNTKPSFTDISESLDLSRPTLQNYLEDLRRKKVINNFTININPNIQPNLKHVIMEIKTNPKEPELVQKLSEIPQLQMLDGIFGEFSLNAMFKFENSAEFNEQLNLVDTIMSQSYFKKYQIIDTIKVYKTNGVKLSEIDMVSYELDDLDYEILKILQYSQEEKLISTYDIKNLLKDKNKISVSQSTIYNRIKKMEESGIILNYSLNFNPRKLGFLGKFIIRIKPNDPSKYDEIALDLEKKKELTHLYRIGSQFGLFGIVRVKQIQDYAGFLQELYNTNEVEDTFSNFVLDERIPFTNFSLP
ncbi:MAG: putative HTH-type transcriptional regulator [Promethearchaeota archaeon]|jgi:DNA-binding Lrp family transcriptional regulator|nr:MAG: putative HTH-type transcriptional regulator [Candidatus Lokiarchaeota archaeon]